jgi:Carboxypeptidase regulatory-like domain
VKKQVFVSGSRCGLACLKVSFVAGLTLLAVIPSLAQLPTATILGNVKDSSGASVPSAIVTARNTDTNLTRTMMTDDDGGYRLLELPVGHYELKAERAGFKTEIRTGITLEVTQQAKIDFALEVGATVQEVTVTGEAPLVNTQDSTLGGTVNETKMSELPLNGRNYVDLSLLQPGVSEDKNKRDSGTSFSVNGATPRSNNFTLDGAILQNEFGRNPVAGESGNALGLDGIKEYKIVTGTFQAEYGMAMGSQMVAVSKGGTNRFHGDAFEYLRNSALDANDFFANAGGVPIAPFQKNQFGAAFGGPIKKDKTFFYAVYEGLRQNLGVPINNLVPAAGCHPPNASAANNFGAGSVITQAQCPDIAPTSSVVLSPYIAPFLALVPLPNVAAPSGGLAAQVGSDHSRNGENYGQMRVDQNFSANDTFFARYTIDNAIQNLTVGDYSYFRDLNNGRNQWITLSENHIFSPSVLNTARFSFSRTNDVLAGLNIGLPNNGMGPSIVPGFATGVIDMGGAAGGTYTEFGSAGYAPKEFNLQNIYTLSDDVNWTRGKHAFKFGTLLNRFNLGFQGTNSFNGQIQFDTMANFLQSNPFLVEFAPTFVNENKFYIFDTAGFYAQDDWRATQRLTINLGFRYEFMTTPRELQGKESRVLNDFTDQFTIGPIIKNNTLHDFGPRVGMAYDLFGNGKTAIRAGAGIYYDMGNIGSVLSSETAGAAPFGGLVDITTSSSPSIADWENTLGTTGFPFPIPNQVRSSYTATTPGVLTPQFIDYNYLSPYMIQYNASVQQQLPWNMVLGVAYVGNHGVHLATIREGNPIFPTSFGPCGDPASLCVGGSVPFWDNGAPNYVNVNPNLSSDINVGTFADSHYNALQIVLEKRTSHGLEFESAYTHSRVTDDTQGQENSRDCTASGGLQGVYPLNPKATDTGPACFNIPNNWEFNMLYHFPSLMKGNSFAAKMVSGWFVSSIVTIESGQPFSPITSSNRSNSGVLQAGQGDRVNINTPAMLAANPCTSQPGQPVVGNNPCPFYTPIPYNANTVITGDPNQWFNPAMFSLSPQSLSRNSEQPPCFFLPPDPNNPCTANTIGQLGNSARNILSGPPFRNWDFSLVKDTKIGFLGEAGMLEFRVEMFNILNHPNFGSPAAAVFSGQSSDLTPFSEGPTQGVGQISAMQGTPRQIQFALRVEF